MSLFPSVSANNCSRRILVPTFIGHLRPAFQMMFLAAILAGLPAGVRGAGSTEADKDHPAAKKSNLTKEEAAKLAKFIDKVGVERRKKFVESLKARIVDLQKVTGLEEDGAKILEGTVDAAADQLMASWREKFPDRFREISEQQYQMSVDLLFAQLETYAGSAAFVQLDPDEAPAWTAALQKVFNPGQAAAWTRTVAERRETKLGEINDSLSREVDAARAMRLDILLKKTAQIKAALALPKGVGDQLDDLAGRQIDDVMRRLREKSAKTLMALEEEQLHSILKNGGGLNFALSSDEQAEQERAWNAGLAAALPAEDLKRWKDLVAARRDKHIRAYTGVLVSEMDRQVAFTAKQREQIEPLAARLIADEPHLAVKETDPSNFIYGNPSRGFYDAAAKADDRDLSAILDAHQLVQWRRVCEAYRNTYTIAFNNNSNGRGSGSTEDALSTPEDLENKLSDYLQDMEERSRQTIFEEMMLKLDDVSRSANLSPEKIQFLQMAAIGSAEAIFENWKASIEQNIRSNISNNVRVGNLEARLRNIGTYSWGGNAGEDPPRWKRAVETELTAAEREAWKSEIEARGRYQDEAASRYVIARFDGAVDLSVDQWGKLEPIVGGIMKDYHDDIARMFPTASGQRPPWYLQYYGLLPFASLSDKDLEGLLTKEQIEAWMSSMDHTNCASMWQNLKRQHDQRVKQKK